ncbi:discoidin domain-containing protein [Roseibium sediminis]|uniref:discoidin domain-containing protein n=1 Tax=Roseibium sediminis TaxID=1775174 RepID=UPI00123D05D6|nr:discoidin domain-containing protein [Roseibium sediminis]
MTYVRQATFSRGELDPELLHRSDLELFLSGLAECENFITLKRGGLRRRGGTRFHGEVKTSATGAWLIPFEFGNGQNYMLEFGEGYFRIHTRFGRVGSVEVATPYPLAVLPFLKFVQSTDTLFITGGGVRQHALKRLAEDQWTIEPLKFKDGPFLPVNISQTSLQAHGTGNPVPPMSSNTAPSGVVRSSNGAADAYAAFNRAPGRVVISSTGDGWISYEFPGAVTVDAYMLQAPNDNSTNDDMPAQWAFEGSNDNVNWTILDTQDAQYTWNSSEWRRFSFPNETAFRFYRFRFTEGGGRNSDNTAIGQIVLHQLASQQAPVALTATSTAGINGGAGFVASDVGRHVRIKGSDGDWRWLEIVGFVHGAHVTVQVHGQSLLDTYPTSIWRLGAWSATTGYPSAVGWHKNRLAFAGTQEEPQTVWESQADDYTRLGVSSPLVASDAITVGILSGQVNQVQWLADDNDLLVGTSKAVRSVGKAIESDPYGPDNVDQKPDTNFGSNHIQPIKIGSVMLYFGQYGTDLRELVYSYEANGRLSQSISEVQSHLFSPGILGACYQQYPDSIVWPWDTNGQAIGFTYEREQQVFGMHRHDFGGVVECMQTIPGEGFDEVWMIVKRSINGQVKRYIEIMQRPFLREDIADAWHLDSALRYEGVPVTTVTGLGHLEGKEVVLFADGSDYRATVTGGAVSLPDERKASKILVGLDVVARAKTLPPPTNAQDGASMGRKMKVDNVKVAVFEAGVLDIGVDGGHIDSRIHYRTGDPYDNPAPLRSEVIDANIEMSWDSGGQIVLEATGGKPCTILALNYNLSQEP